MIEPTSAASIAAANKALKTAKGFWNRLKPSTKAKVWVKIEKQFTSFSQYLATTHERAANVQLICSRSIVSSLDDIYIPTTFNKHDNHNEQISDNDLISDIRDGQRVVIRGNGGSGKTLFMKRLWLDVFTEPKGKIPVMIELRKFNQFSDINISTLIRNTISTTKSISEDLFQELATDGTFFFVFDGFDEVAVERRDEVEAQILEFERLYKKCNIVVSSRPNENFVGWQVFHTYDVMPFTREQTLALIDKVPLDEGLLKRFKQLLSKDFFNKYEEFLSSPLLALMMLVTFKRKGDISDISDNIIEFYDNAFHALYSEHDAIKEQYKRPHCLKINDFRLVFSTFCLFSYYKEKFEFREAEIHEFIRKSIEHVNLTKDANDKIKCSVEDVMHEVLDSVNLMRKDGLLYLFIHRSFQEYFAAYWIISVDSKRTEKILADVCLRPQDNVLKLCYQMNKSKVDENYVLPFYDRFLSSGVIYKTKPPNKQRWKYIENYKFVPIWTLKRYKKDKDDKYTPGIFKRWENGEIGRYYANLNVFVFKGVLSKQFYRTVDKSLQSARPVWLIKDFYKEIDFTRKQLRAEISADGIALILSDDGKNPKDVTAKYLQGNTKYKEKLERALDDIEAMLHELNKTVNLHIGNIRQGHSASEKNLDDMFF